MIATFLVGMLCGLICMGVTCFVLDCIERSD